MGRVGAGIGASMRQTARLALTPGLRQSIRLLRMPAADLAGALVEAAAGNPWIDLGAPPRHGDSDSSGTGELPDRTMGLIAHVCAQIDHAFPAGPDRAIALAFAGALAPTGWLDSDVGEIAAEAGVAEDAAAAVLARLQRFDPPGVFARSLAECLRLQAEDAGLLDPGMVRIIDRLDLLAAGDTAALAAAAALDHPALAVRIAAIRRFDPKPGVRFAAASPPQPPDILVSRTEAGLEVTLNDAALPPLRLRAGPADDPGWRAARDLVAAVARRQATLLAVAQHVLHHQAAAVEAGPGALRPLTRAAVAAALGLAESTVSRAVAGAAVRTPRGTRPLSAYFAAALGDEATAARAQAMLRRAVADEEGAPLSDAALAALLAEAGIPAARRTVAKYRAALGIPSAARRRRQP
ncbi:MAG: RNA polymerase sigma-54 factor [Gemmobacter sp.]